MTPYLQYNLNAILKNVQTIREATLESGRTWAPRLSRQTPPKVLQVILDATQKASCSEVINAEKLSSAGFQSVMIARPIVETNALSRMAILARQCELTIVVDHFRHAELASQAALACNSSIRVLVEVDTGRKVGGVRPGPDSVLLAAAVAQLPGLTMSGVFADDNDVSDETTDMNQSLTFEQSTGVALHCQRMIQANGVNCSEIASGFGHIAHQSRSVTIVMTDPMRNLDSMSHVGSHQAGHPHRPQARFLLTRVISRPTLEWCVINAELASITAAGRNRLTLPSGARFLHSKGDVSTLELSGESLDLRIGDEVLIGNYEPSEWHDLPIIVVD